MYRKFKPNRKLHTRTCNNVGVMSVTNVRVASPIEKLTIERLPSVHGKTKEVKYRNDVYLLFNQKRLDKMTLQAFSEYLDSMPTTSNDGLSELRSKVSDADLLKFVKSRYIQSRSELLAWSQYITANYAQAQQEVKDYLAQQQADEGKQDVEPQQTE